MKQNNEDETTDGRLVFPVTLVCPLLRSGLKESDYAARKVYFWFSLCRRGLLPTEWHEVTTEGTTVTVRRIETESDYIKSVTDYKHYVNEVEAEHDLDLEMEFRVPESEV